jgi:hypothetical protein
MSRFNEPCFGYRTESVLNWRFMPSESMCMSCVQVEALVLDQVTADEHNRCLKRQLHGVVLLGSIRD